MTTVTEFAAKIVIGDANLDRLQSAINDAPGNFTTSAGTLVPNLRKRLEDIGYMDPVPFVAGLSATDASFTVTYLGNTYAANSASIPFVTSDVFNPDQWVRPVFLDEAEAYAASAAASAAQAALYDGPKVDTFAELASVTPSMLAVGEYIRVISTGAVYQRVASGGHLDYSGSGGVRLNVMRDAGGLYPVDAFGALGDGVTNDSTALQKAFSAGAVALREGATYLASTLLDATHPVYGNGATIAGQVQVLASDVVLHDLHVRSPLAIYGVYLKGLSGAPISNVQMRGCTVSFSGGTAALRLGVQAQYISDMVIDGCRIDYGANFIRCPNYRLTNNVLNGFNQNENELLHATVRSYGIVSGNTFLNSFDNWIDLYSSGEKTVITGNRFDGCQCRLGTGIEIKVSLTDDPSNTSGGTNDYGYTKYIVFSDNYVGNAVQSIAASTSVMNIYYIDSRAVPAFSWGDVPTGISITGNIFEGFNTTSSGGMMANVISLFACEGVNIADNTFKNIHIGGSPADASACVWVEGCRNVIVSGNYMTTRVASGISLHAACDNITIDGNHVAADPTNGYAPVFGINATKIGSRPSFALTNIAITNNRIDGSIASVRALSTNGSIFDLLMSGNNCSNETVLENANRCTVTGNILGVSATRFKALGMGYTGGIVAHNIVTGNTIKSPSGTPKPGIELNRVRASVISQNIIHTASNGLFVIGTGASNELDNLIIKDNLSISQTGVNFPSYSSMSAADTALLTADTNRKVT